MEPRRPPDRGGPGYGRGPERDPRDGPAVAIQVFFDPGKPRVELVDELAEKQAKALREVTSSQLRRFFGEVKDLHRRLGRNQDYQRVIEPQFKMLRSKAYYASRGGGGQQRINDQFRNFIENATAKVQTEDDFRRFVEHFEAVVGFLYGMRLVKG